MSRLGITAQHVVAAEAMQAEGQQSTIRAVRERQGDTCSPNTIQRHLTGWRKTRPAAAPIQELLHALGAAIAAEIDQAHAKAAELAQRARRWKLHATSGSPGAARRARHACREGRCATDRGRAPTRCLGRCTPGEGIGQGPAGGRAPAGPFGGHMTVEKITHALALLRQCIEALPPERRQLMRDAVAGYVLGADVPADHIAQALAALKSDS